MANNTESNLIPMNLQMFAEPGESTEPATPEAGTDAGADTGTPASEPTISRGDFLQAPMLRNFKREPEVKGPEDTVIPEAVPPEGNLDKKTEPEGTEGTKPAEPTEPESKPNEPETPEVIKLPDGKEATLEQIAEWEKGYMMQADYTRKTQQLAEEKKQFQNQLEQLSTANEQAKPALDLWQAFERDPIGTIEELQAHFAGQGIFEAKDPEVLAREDRIRQLDQESRQREQEWQQRQQEFAQTEAQHREQEAYNWLVSQLDTLSQQHADFDRDKVTQYMLSNNIPDPGKAYELMSAPTLREKTKALEAEKETLQKEIEAKTKEAADKAVAEYIKTKTTASNTPPPVGGSGGGTPPVQIHKPMAWQDARKAALSRIAGS